ncbi:MAG: hypothetical protein N2115_01485 [bacterium]|nr:hypothetical protein [bacterium]
MKACFSCFFLIFLISVLFSYAHENFVFSRHPRFLYTSVEIENIKKDSSKSIEIQNIIKQADSILDEPLRVPEKEGDWIFYYACPKDDATLKAETESRHICPACGPVYTDARASTA